jgi:hypothetical protein
MKIGEILKDSAGGTLFFILGYTLGSLYDRLFYQIYRKIDPVMNNNISLVSVVTMQLFLLICIVIFLTNEGIIVGVDLVFMRMGLISSQIFLLQWTLKKLTNDRAIGAKENTRSDGLVPY